VPTLLISSHLSIRKWHHRVLKNVKFPAIRRFDGWSTPTLPEILAATEIALTDLIGSRQPGSIPTKVRALGPTTNKSDAIAGMFMPIFKGELGDP
jgi:hypothetical protein